MNMDPIEPKADVDQWLDVTLGNYGKAEPRPGLESRVLANLRSERSRIASRWHWCWTMGAAAALAAMVVTVWIGEGVHEQNRRKPVTASTTKPDQARRGSIHSGPAVQIARAPTGAPRPGRANPSLQHPSAVPEPRLAQFPSPRDLSEQELLLVRHFRPQSDEPLLEDTATRAEPDVGIDSLEVSPLEIPNIEISESNENY